MNILTALYIQAGYPSIHREEEFKLKVDPVVPRSPGGLL